MQAKALKNTLQWLSVASIAAVMSTVLIFDGFDGLVMLSTEDYQPLIEVSDSGLREPDGLAYHDGEIFIADEGASAVRVWTGSELITLCDEASGLGSPEDLVVDATGMAYVTDDEAGGIWSVSRDGECAAVPGTRSEMKETEGIVISPEGMILAGEGLTQKIYRVSPTGEVSSAGLPGSEIGKADSMAFDTTQNLYISDDDQSAVYLWSTAEGLQTLLKGLPDFSPESIEYADGALLITDSRTGKFYRYTRRSGVGHIATFAGSLRGLNGIVVDENGDMYIAVQPTDGRTAAFIVKLTRKG